MDDSDEKELIIQKKINMNLPEEEMINNMNNLINKAINKIQNIESQKNSEINSLHERLEFYLKEMKVIKQSNEALSKNIMSSALEIQKEKYEKQLKIKDETIQKLHSYIYEINKTKQDENKNMSDLTEELNNMKKKYEIQTKNFQNIGERAKEQNKRSAMKDVSTGKYVINEYLNKLHQFANGLFNYNEPEE